MIKYTMVYRCTEDLQAMRYAITCLVGQQSVPGRAISKVLHFQYNIARPDEDVAFGVEALILVETMPRKHWQGIIESSEWKKG